MMNVVDPEAEQLRELQRLLIRMMRGEGTFIFLRLATVNWGVSVKSTQSIEISKVPQERRQLTTR